MHFIVLSGHFSYASGSFVTNNHSSDSLDPVCWLWHASAIGEYVQQIDLRVGIFNLTCKICICMNKQQLINHVIL